MFGQNKYIYGFIEEPQTKEFGFVGVGNAKVYTINHQRLAAIVSDTEFPDIDPSRKNVLAHTVVQDELLKNYMLLPTGFGTVADGTEAVQRLLEKNYDRLVLALKRLAGKIEVELKVFWDEKAMIKQLQDESRELAQIKMQLEKTSSPIEARVLMTQAGRLVEKAVMDWQAKYAQQAFDRLRRIAADAYLNKPIGIQNILNASFLVDKDREKEFREEVHRLDLGYEGKVNFKYVAPLPPYNFVKIKLERVE